MVEATRVAEEGGSHGTAKPSAAWLEEGSRGKEGWEEAEGHSDSHKQET